MGNIWSSFVTSLLELLQWPTLYNLRYISRLHIFTNLFTISQQNSYHLTIAVWGLNYLPDNTILYISLCHPVTAITIICIQIQLFFPRDWNNLPHGLIERNCLNLSCWQSFDSELILIAYIIVGCLNCLMYSFGLVPWTHHTLSACPTLKIF